MIEFACGMGGEHAYAPTGDGYYCWTSHGTVDMTPPFDADYHAELRCWKCGASKHVIDPSSDPRYKSRDISVERK